jgi:hypothetical protein
MVPHTINCLGHEGADLLFIINDEYLDHMNTIDNFFKILSRKSFIEKGS